MEGLPDDLLLNFFWLQKSRKREAQRARLKTHPVDGDGQGAQCLLAGNALTPWYQSPEKTNLMRKNKREVHGKMDKALF